MATSDVYRHGFDEDSSKTISADTCPECTGDIQTDGGEIRCTDCGLILDEYRFDHGHKRVSFDDHDDDPERTGAPLTPARHDRGLSTEIGRGRDARGSTLSGKKRRQLGRLRVQHSRARWQSKAERNLAHACTEIARLTSALDLSKSLRKGASMLYRRAQAADLIEGRSIETMAAGSVYAACRVRGIHRTIAAVAEVAQRPRQKVELGFRVLNVELELGAKLIGVPERIPRLATACNASDVVRRRARELAELAEETGIANGRNPAGVAAACLYLASDEFDSGLTQAQLAELADVAPATLRQRYYELLEES